METTPPRIPAAMKLRASFASQCLANDLAGLVGRSWGKQRISNTDGVGAESAVDWRVLPLRSPGGDPHRTDPGGPGPTTFAPTVWLEYAPYLAEVLGSIPAPLNAARLMALGPGAASAEHCDPKYALHRGLVRLHVPITTNPDAVLVLDGVRHRWQPGELWLGEFARPHHVHNNGTSTRVHLVIDALMTSELATWVPTVWVSPLGHGEALFTRPTVPPCPDTIPRVLRLPSWFTDFTLTSEPEAPPPAPTVAMRLASDADTWKLTDHHQRVFALAHLGDGEFRFAGWSEQRTLHLHGNAAIVRTRTPTTVHEIPCPPADGKR